MLAKVKSFGLMGLDGFLVDVEVDISYGFIDPRIRMGEL